MAELSHSVRMDRIDLFGSGRRLFDHLKKFSYMLHQVRVVPSSSCFQLRSVLFDSLFIDSEPSSGKQKFA